jgi:hypothetical protein
MELIERGAYLADLGEHLAATAAGNGRLVRCSSEKARTSDVFPMPASPPTMRPCRAPA